MQPDLSQIEIAGDVRRAALANWQESGWPGPRDEAWRYTRLDGLTGREITPAAALTDVTAGDGATMAARLDAHVIRIVNGVIDSTSLDGAPDGLTIRQLGDDVVAQSLMMELAPAGHPVSTLSMAVMSTGLVLDVDGFVARPVMLLFEGDGAEISAHPVVLTRLAAGASLVLAEWHQSALGLAAPLLGFDLAAGARLDFAKVQAEGSETTHLAATGVRLGENATLAGFSLSIGATLARLETHVTMAGEGADCQLSAIYLGRDGQHHDITTFLDHAVGHCKSDQIIRGVLDDRARGVYQGKVRVAEGAQKTDGQQMCRALLLSRKAEADAKPELEIYADDVVCAHGATVGELDAAQLFYLTSRGIPEAQARAMLIEAFLIDAIEQVETATLARMLRIVADGWMARRTIAKSIAAAEQGTDDG